MVRRRVDAPKLLFFNAARAAKGDIRGFGAKLRTCSASLDLPVLLVTLCVSDCFADARPEGDEVPAGVCEPAFRLYFAYGLAPFRRF